MTYLMRGSCETRSCSASTPLSRPCRGSLVMSMAVTTPSSLGLWSDARAECAASPMVPSLATLRPGAIAFTCLRNVSRDCATRQFMFALPLNFPVASRSSLDDATGPDAMRNRSNRKAKGV